MTSSLVDTINNIYEIKYRVSSTKTVINDGDTVPSAVEKEITELWQEDSDGNIKMVGIKSEEVIV